MSVVLGWLPQPIGGIAIIQQGFFDSVFRFIAHDTTDRQAFMGFVYASNAYIPAGRCQLVRSFLDTGADHLLMLDWDVSFTPEDVYAVLDAANDEWDVVMGCYVTWFGEGGGLRPCWFIESDGQEFVPAPEFRSGEVVPLTVAGMGFTLIHRELFLRMEKACNDDPWPWFGHDVINTDRVGEDITFSTRARRCGARIWGHGGVQLGHTKIKTLYPKDMIDGSLMWADTAQTLSAKAVLNVGGGSKAIPLPPVYDGWAQVLLDIKPGQGVDLAMDARDLLSHDKKYDAVYCSHNIEHYEVHDVPKVLAGMAHVLKPGGTVDIRCPDFGEVFRRIDSGEVKLHDEAYTAPAGPILYSDILFGYGKKIEESGEPYYIHRTAFTERYLRQVLEEAGFEQVEVLSSELELEAKARKP